MLFKIASSFNKSPNHHFILKKSFFPTNKIQTRQFGNIKIKQNFVKKSLSGTFQKKEILNKCNILLMSGCVTATSLFVYNTLDKFKLSCQTLASDSPDSNISKKNFLFENIFSKFNNSNNNDNKEQQTNDFLETNLHKDDDLLIVDVFQNKNDKEERIIKEKDDQSIVENNKQEKNIDLQVIENEKKRTNPLSLWAILYHYVKSDYVYFFIAIPCAVLSAYFNIRINLSLGDLMNVIQSNLKSSDLSNGDNFLRNFLLAVKQPSIDLMMNYCAQSIFNFFYLYSLFIMSEQTANRLRSDLFTKFLSQELTFFDLNNAGGTISALSNDIQEFKSSFKQVISLGIKNLSQILGSVTTLYRISPEMTISINLIIIPSIAFIGQQIGSKLRKISIALQAQLGEITDVAFESINNIRTVKMLGLEDILQARFANEIHIFDKLNRTFSFGFSLFQSLTNFTFNGIILVTLLFGGHNLLSGNMTAGNLMSFLATTQTIQRSLFQLSLLYGHYIKLTSSLTRISNYLALPSPVYSGIKIDNFIGNIVFKDVVFSYPKRSDFNVLKKISLTLEPGKITALCGTSGSGKSTIAMLLECLYDFQSGQITIDGHDIRYLDRNWLRKDVIGYISQEPILFCTSIMENIRYGNPKATDEEIYEAAKLANAHDFIMRFPSGYQTIVGQQGTAVSGGQRQRIAIARAIVKNPKILILDEATSALDSESEALIKNSLEKVMLNRTVLVIAHRLSTIVNSDHIIVVDNGHILEHGTHRELLKMKGKYFQLVMKSLQKNKE